MKMRTDGKTWKERGMIIGAFLLLFLVLSICFDFYYDLNDDMALKDLLSGTYTGEPYARNIQMLYPLSLGLSALYKISAAIPWFGIFLLGSQAVSLMVISGAMMGAAQEVRMKKWILLSVLFASAALMLYELVFIQYTVTAACLAIAGIVRIALTGEHEFKGFWDRNLVSVFLLLIAFALRPNMMLLLTPFLGLVLIDRVFWDGEEAQRHLDRKERLSLLVSFLIILIGLMAAMKISDYGAYSSSKWSDFRAFFDARTDVYDYYGIPDYEENKELYSAIGLEPTEYVLLTNYNFGIDPDIDTECMKNIASYAAKNQQGSFFHRLYLSVYTYIYRIIHGQEAGFDLVMLAGYFVLFRLAFAKRNKRLLFDVTALFLLRNALWIYLIYRGRIPERITHPLYMVEFALMFVFFLVSRQGDLSDSVEKPDAGRKSRAVVILFYLLIFCCGIMNVSRAGQEAVRRKSVNQNWEDLKEYCLADTNHFYSLDVYSTVSYSEKMFAGTSADYRNFDLAGGWLSKSPAEYDKLLQSGMADLSDALLSGKALFVIDEKRDPSFLEAYYSGQGETIELEETDRIDNFVIYTIKR